MSNAAMEVYRINQDAARIAAIAAEMADENSRDIACDVCGMDLEGGCKGHPEPTRAELYADAMEENAIHNAEIERETW